MDPILMIIVLSLAAKYAGSDVLYALRGKANPRHEAVAKTRSARTQARATRATARASKSKARLARVQQRTERRANSALKRYWDVLKEDAVDDAIAGHQRRRAHKHERIEKREEARAKLRDGAPDTTPGDTEPARGPARVYFMNRVNDARRAARKNWEQRWDTMEKNAQERKFKAPAPGDVVPGTVVSSEEDSTPEQPARPQDDTTFQQPAQPARPQDQPGPAPETGTAPAASETPPPTEATEPADEAPAAPRHTGAYAWVYTNYDGVHVPLDAERDCSKCDGKLTPVTGEDLYADEGDGFAMVNTVCNKGCGISSYHSWPLNDFEYQTIFGHAFGDRPDDEDEDDEHDTTEMVAEALHGVNPPGTAPSGQVALDQAPVRPLNQHNRLAWTPGPSGADFHHPTTEGNPEMTNAPIEVTGLNSAIANANTSAENCRNAANGIELTVAGLTAGGTTGPAIDYLNAARESLNTAADQLDASATELGTQTSVGDAYAATGGHAGSKEFVTAD